MEKINVIVNGNTETVAVIKGITLLELSSHYQYLFKSPIVLAKVNNELYELNKTISYDCNIEFIDITDADGMRVYQRSLSFVLICAIKEIFGKSTKVVIEHSINKNLYCEIEGMSVISEKILCDITEKMQELIDNDVKIEKHTFPLEEGIEIVKSFGMDDKVKILKYRRTSNVNLYKLTWLYDYFYGCMVASCGCLKHFKLLTYDSGFILVFPTRETPNIITEHKPIKKISQVFKEYSQWGKILNVDTVGALNDIICQGKIGELIRISEALQEKKIAQIADQIKEYTKNVKIILVAGPSSSGKTTFAKRLCIQLRVIGLTPHIISVDNYFVNRDQAPKDEFGNYDLESIKYVDVEKLNVDLQALLKGEAVSMPTFNFLESKREYRGNFLKLDSNDVLVIEGIHSLNDDMTYSIERDLKFKIFISALTQLSIDNHNRISTTDTRILRRIVRDNQFRGTRADVTISMWKSVLKGEIENIFPFQEDADAIFNSALIYELCILKSYVEPLLFQIERNIPQYTEARRLIKFLDCFLAISSEEVPNNSIIREFIGGSCFNV